MTRITAPSDLTHDVVTEKPSEAEAEKDNRKLDKFAVLTNLAAVVEGGVKYVQSVIVDPDKKGKKTQTMKFPVKQLFADAPDTAAYSWTKKFSEFMFPPGKTYSDYGSIMVPAIMVPAVSSIDSSIDSYKIHDDKVPRSLRTLLTQQEGSGRVKAKQLCQTS